MGTSALGKRDCAIDFLKAVSIFLVIVWHLKPIKFLCDGGAWCPPFVQCYEFFEEQICMLAVPMFFLASLVLFFRRLGPSFEVRYFFKRMRRLSWLFVFWGSVQYALYIVVKNNSPTVTWKMIASGGPSLPIVYGSVFYFLFSLLVLTLFAFALHCASLRLPRATRLLSWVILAGCLAFYEYDLYEPSLTSPYYSVLNFIPFVPLAFLLHARRPLSKLQLAVLVSGWMLLVAHDAAASFQAHLTLSSYGRSGIVLGVVAAYCLACRVSLHCGPAVKFASNYSLGLFALHKYCWFALAKLFTLPSWPIHLGGLGLDVFSLAFFLLVLLCSSVAAYLIGKTSLRWSVA